MQEFLPICCQENCPYGKHCCFGEVSAYSIGDKPLVERHKCPWAKKKGEKFIIVTVEKAA